MHPCWSSAWQPLGRTMFAPLKTKVTSSPGCTTVTAFGWTAAESLHTPLPWPDAGST
jgi:hypothetical protein